MAVELILVRHGRTQWNQIGKVQGRTDVPLDEVGREQASLIARRLSTLKVDAIYSSPLSRAYDTAKAIAAFHDCGIRMAQELTEIQFGMWEGKTNQELALEYAELWQDWNWIMRPETCREMGAESAYDILERAKCCLNAILDAYPEDGRVVIVSHTLPIKLLVSHMVGFPISGIRSLRLDNCSFTAVRAESTERGQLYAWNDTCHMQYALAPLERSAT